MLARPAGWPLPPASQLPHDATAAYCAAMISPPPLSFFRRQLYAIAFQPRFRQLCRDAAARFAASAADEPLRRRCLPLILLISPPFLLL